MLTPEQLQELETVHKRIAHVRGKNDSWEVVYRKPTRAEYKRMRSMAHNPSQTPDAMEIMARAIVVHPSKEDFDKLLDEYPGIPEASAKAFSELAGLTVEESEKA